MDPGKQKQSAAAADDANNNKSSPDVDAALAAYMQKAMRVDDLTLEEMQQATQQGYYNYVAPTSLPLACQWVPQLQASPHNLPLAQDLQMTQRFWPKTPPPQPEPWEASRSSPRGFPHFSLIGAYQYQAQSVASSSQQPPYTLSTIQYQPFASLPSVVASTSSTSTNNTAQAQYYQYMVPVPAAAAHYQYQSGEASYAPDDFCLEPNQIQMHPRQTAQETLRLPESPERVVRLLEDGDERTRQSVLYAVRSRVHAFMDSEEGHEVFVALLHACWDRPDELKAIVDVAVPPRPNYYSYGKASLLRASKHEYYWDASLKELITAVARYPDDLCSTLLEGLLREGLMEHAKGEQLVQHCFATMRYEDTKILLRTAHYQFNFLLKSSLGSKCIVECFANARDKELHDFQQRLLNDAVNIATGEYSNYFVQHALEHGSSDEFKQGLIEQLMADVEHLSLNQYGSYVVEKCLKKTGLLYRVLLAFLRLHPDQLANLVRGKFANYVVQKLLDTGKHRFPSETMMLAQTIERLPKNVLENEYAKKVTKMSRKIVLSRRRRQYYG